MEKALSKEQRILTTIRNVLVVLALSLHSVFEGMAVGEFTLLY
jgi:zinc transporter ZupT